MKKISTLLILLCSSLSMMATDYKGNLAASISGAMATPQQTTITVNQQSDGKYEFSLKNFSISYSGTDMAVGNVEMKNVSATETDGVVNLSSAQTITIESGDDSGTFWMGPFLGDVDVTLSATISNGVLAAVIDIPFEFNGEVLQIKVFFSSAPYQIGNSDFEEYHKENNIDEANHWHSFGSCTGTFANMVNNAVHTIQSTDIRPASTGKSSLLVKSTSISLGIIKVIANGTITTGRMNAGAMSATDTKNHAFLDLTNTDKDSNGDPFYTELQGHPDYLSVWVKFKQATAKAAHPYATVNAVITDGTRYQDPEDKTYTNVVAKATNVKIEGTGEWQQLQIPFDYAAYAANNADAKAILVTMSTNADAGQGSDGDELYVDDLSLVYSAELSSLKVEGINATKGEGNTYTVTVPAEPTAADFAGTATSAYAKVVAVVDSENKQAIVNVISEDLLSSASYTVTYTVDPNVTNIGTTVSPEGKKVTGVYNLNGQQVSQKSHGQVYVTKYSDGTATKTVEK